MIASCLLAGGEAKKVDNEKKKEYLKQYRMAVKAVKILEDDIKELRLSKMCPSVVLDDMPRSRGINDLSGYAAKVDEQIRKLKEARYKRISLYTDINTRIKQMDNEMEKNILRLKYIQGLSFLSVAIAIGCKRTKVYETYKSAIENFKL